MWAPAAGVVAVAGILFLSVPEWQHLPSQAGDGLLLHVSSIEDDGGIRMTIGGSAPAVRRVAVSSRSDDFGEAHVFEVQGSDWLDPMPEPAAGQAFFYRVD